LYLPNLTMTFDINKQQEKRQKLLGLMNSVIDDPKHKDEFAVLFDRLGLSRDLMPKAFLDYNMDVHTHDNAIYKYQAIRVVLHIHNLIPQSWHIERQEAICQLIESANAFKAIDLGFGVPSRYVKQMLARHNYALTLCDYQPAALSFAETLLNCWDRNWRQKIELLCEDLENIPACAKDYDLYISLHSIEHVANPTKCLRDYVKASLPHAKFLIEIPIGPITPEHTIAWANSDETRAWIDSVGLKIIDEHITWVNPEVDVFAEVHDFNYGGHLMLCQKN
jgi:SAM-dependent methyltransferase